MSLDSDGRVDASAEELICHETGFSKLSKPRETRRPMTLKRTTSFLVASCCILIAAAQGQVLQTGGIQGEDIVLLTPDKKLNEKIRTKDIRLVSEFGFDDRGERINFSPKLPAAWNWLAALNVQTQGRLRNFFLYDGWLFTTVNLISGYRVQNFQRDVTKFVRSNAYHIAFHRKKVVENEIVLLVVSPKKQRVRVELDSAYFGHRRVLEYDMGALESKYVNVNIVPDEFTVVTWGPEVVPRRVISLNEGW